jgi:hypothetical protein
MDETNQLPLWSRFFRYLIHGVAFSILFLILALVWIFIFAFLVILGSFIGFIIGFIVLFFFIGGLNTILTRWIWSTDTRSDWIALFMHGLGLFFALLIVGLPMFFLIGTPYGLVLSITLFVPYALIDGFIAKNIAFTMRKHDVREYSETTIQSDRITDQDTEIKREPTDESSEEEEAAEASRLYDKLLSKYANHWGYQTGTRMLNDEIAAHTRHGDTFAEAVRKVNERQDSG